MPAVTPNRAYPYQLISDSPAGHSLGEQLGLAVDADMAAQVAAIAALQAQVDQQRVLTGVAVAGQNLATSDTTLQNLTGLTVSATVGTWAWELLLPYECSNNTPDIKVALTFPTASSASYAYTALALTASGVPPYSINMAGGSLTSGTAFATAGTVGLRATLHAYGHLVLTAAGTVQAQAAQNTSDPNTVTVHPGAQLILRPNITS